MKQLTAFFLAALLAAGLSACGEKSVSKAAESAQPQPSAVSFDPRNEQDRILSLVKAAGGDMMESGFPVGYRLYRLEDCQVYVSSGMRNVQEILLERFDGRARYFTLGEETITDVDGSFEKLIVKTDGKINQYDRYIYNQPGEFEVDTSSGSIVSERRLDHLENGVYGIMQSGDLYQFGDCTVKGAVAEFCFDSSEDALMPGSFPEIYLTWQPGSWQSGLDGGKKLQLRFDGLLDLPDKEFRQQLRELPGVMSAEFVQDSGNGWDAAILELVIHQGVPVSLRLRTENGQIVAFQLVTVEAVG